MLNRLLLIQFCRENGGMLAEPRSNRQNRIINKMINNNRDDTNYWIGNLI